VGRLLIFGLIFGALVVLWQWRSGCYQSDLAANPDEPAHVVSSLLIRDYLADGMPEAPLRFARNYYVHYPKVAIGHWPPLFYAAEAMWMLVFGRTKAAMLAMVAVNSVALLICVFAWVSRRCGTVAGLCASVVLMLPLFMRETMDSVEPDIVLALLAFLAAASYGSFLETGRRKYVFVFWILAAASLLTHGRGAAVCFLPAVAALTRRRFRPAWIATLPSAAFVAAATILPNWLGQTYPFSLRYALASLWTFPLHVIAVIGWPVFIVALIGCIAILHSAPQYAGWHAMYGLILGGFLFYILVSVPIESRYLVTIAPGVAALFGGGISPVTSFAAARWRLPFAGGALATLACAATIPLMHVFDRKPDPGFHRIVSAGGAAGIAAQVYLIAGDPQNEGAFIVEMALADPRRERIVLRASKMLAQSSWIGTDYKLLFNDPQSLAAWLDEAHVGAVILQTSDPRPHTALLRSATTRPDSSWAQVYDVDAPRGIAIFRRAGPMPPGQPSIRIDMHWAGAEYFELEH